DCGIARVGGVCPAEPTGRAPEASGRGVPPSGTELGGISSSPPRGSCFLMTPAPRWSLTCQAGPSPASLTYRGRLARLRGARLLLSWVLGYCVVLVIIGVRGLLAGRLAGAGQRGIDSFVLTDGLPQLIGLG